MAKGGREHWAKGKTALEDERIARIARGHIGIKITRRTPPELCKWVRGRDISWSRGLTKDTDERVRRNAMKHVGLHYKRRTPREIWRLTHSCQRLAPIGWTSETAYAAGLVATDGNLSKSGRHVQFISTDVDLVETFLTCVGHRIKFRTIHRPRHRTAYEAAFSDVELYRWLLSIGIMPRKSLILGPLIVPVPFLHDVVRGLMDGDGTIQAKCYCKHRRKPHRHIALVFHSASQQHLEWLQTEVTHALGTSGRLSDKKRDGRVYLHLLTYGTEDARRILAWVYQDASAPRLARKWGTWQDYCAHVRLIELAQGGWRGDSARR